MHVTNAVVDKPVSRSGRLLIVTTRYLVLHLIVGEVFQLVARVILDDVFVSDLRVLVRRVCFSW